MAEPGAALVTLTSPDTEELVRQLDRRRRARVIEFFGALAILLAALFLSGWISDVTPHALSAGLPRVGAYFAKLIPPLQGANLFGDVKTEGSLAFWFYRLRSWSWLLFETSQMALLATLAGGVLAFVPGFLAAENLAPNRWVYLLTRRTLELFRCIPDIVYALIFVWAFGVGPMAGIFAIALHTIGALGKQLAEAAENIQVGPCDAIAAAGGSWSQTVRFGAVPQVLPNFLSYLLLRFEINVRGATVIGFVGGGGIGQELYQVISFNYYQEVSAIVVLIILMVAAIDIVSERLRYGAIGAVA